MPQVETNVTPSELRPAQDALAPRHVTRMLMSMAAREAKTPRGAARDTGGPELSPTLVDHATRPRNLGALERADATGGASRPCGDSIELSLVVRGGVITRVGYVPRSCIWTLACASIASTMIQGLTPAEARRAIGPSVIIDALGGLPAGEEHCASLVATAIQNALDDFLRTELEPWKRLYRTK